LKRHVALRTLAACCAALAAGFPARAACADDVPPAPGGVHLVAALEQAPAALVVVFDAPKALDDEAWLATARVEHSLRGEAPERVSIAWEERARARPVRFAAGDRVLIAAEALPGYSIWRQRIPDAEQRARTWFVAENGDAFLRTPGPGSMLTLEHYLRLAPDVRHAATGVGYLVDLAEAAEPPLALSATERIAALGNLGATLDAGSVPHLIRALLRPDATDELREGLLNLIASGPRDLLQPPLEKLAQADALAPAPVFEALARIGSGSLPSDQALRLLDAKGSVAHRRVGARHASGAAVQRLPAVLRSDPAPPVRAAAAERWLAQRGLDGVDAMRPALRDSDPAVRNAALIALAKLGPGAVPTLRGEIESAPPEEARPAVAALVLAGGPESVRALKDLAANHPDAGVRMLAETALGRPLGHLDAK
jgi:HEAT repeat protein